MPYAYLHDSDKSDIATRAVRKLKPEIENLKAEFGNANGALEQRMTRIEGQLAELLSLLKPDELSKPALLKKPAGQKP